MMLFFVKRTYAKGGLKEEEAKFSEDEKKEKRKKKKVKAYSKGRGNQETMSNMNWRRGGRISGSGKQISSQKNRAGLNNNQAR